MRYKPFLLGVILLLASSSKAQGIASDSLALVSPSFETSLISPANGTASFATIAPAPPAPFAMAAPVPAPEPQNVQGVFENFSWQAYAGYTFLRFYEVPGVSENQNGLNAGVTWYYRDWIGVDGQMLAAYGTQAGASSWSFFGGAGPKVRWGAPRGIDVWSHALVGVAHFTPKTPYGNENAFAYEFGGGIDLNMRHKRFAYRLEGDLLGTHYFGTYQYSPQVSASIVYKF